MCAQIQAAKHVEVHADVGIGVRRRAASAAVADLHRESPAVTAESVRDLKHRGSSDW